MPPPRNSDDPMPGFVIPDSHIFYLDDPPPHEMTLKISNPYSFHIRYTVLSSDPDKYTILSDPQGCVKPLSNVEITIRHKAVVASNVNCTDTIRVKLYVYGESLPHHVKNIYVTLQARKPNQFNSRMPPSMMDNERYPRSIGGAEAHLPKITSQSPDLVMPRAEQAAISKFAFTRNPVYNRDVIKCVWESRNKIFMMAIATAVCLVLLWLPCDEQGENVYLPSYLRVTHGFKLFVAYVLGFLTSTLFRS